MPLPFDPTAVTGVAFVPLTVAVLILKSRSTDIFTINGGCAVSRSEVARGDRLPHFDIFTLLYEDCHDEGEPSARVWLTHPPLPSSNEVRIEIGHKFDCIPA